MELEYNHCFANSNPINDLTIMLMKQKLFQKIKVENHIKHESTNVSENFDIVYDYDFIFTFSYN